MAREIYLANGKGVALVDDEDYAWLSAYRWCRNNRGYATAFVEGRPVLMHRMVAGASEGDGVVVDHRNGDKLDNRKNNLRRTTDSLNKANRVIQRNNTSGYKGVSWHERGQKWQARIKVNGHHRHIGLYPTAEAAARAYDEAALREFGEFAKLNFPDELAA